jgi:hypothetical protein
MLFSDMFSSLLSLATGWVKKGKYVDITWFTDDTRSKWATRVVDACVIWKYATYIPIYCFVKPEKEIC